MVLLSQDRADAARRLRFRPGSTVNASTSIA